MLSVQRLKAEEKECAALEYPLSAGPVEDDLHTWKATIGGPEGTPYEGGVFSLMFAFSDKYPITPPSVTFLTPIYHSNISDEGLVCLDVLKDRWSPVLTVVKVLHSISSLLNDPNPGDPLNTAASDLYYKNRAEHDEVAQSWTATYAVDVD